MNILDLKENKILKKLHTYFILGVWRRGDGI